MSAAQPKPAKKANMRRMGAVVYRVRRRIATGLAVVLAIFFAFHVVFGRNGVNNYEQKRVQDKALQEQIDALQQENSQLKDHVGRLKHDPDAIEFEAREKLHYARPGEVIYTLNQPQPSNDKPSTDAAPANGGSN